MTDTFPRQYARTQRLTLGEPRSIQVSPDGNRVVFCRSRSGGDAVNCLWVMDATSGEERLVADPRVLLAGPSGDERLPPEERARRERARESAGGVVAYATDRACTVAAFALDGRLFAAGLVSATARELEVDGPVFDPRPDPGGRRLAYVSGATLRIAELDGSSRVLAGESDVTWGSAEFVAAEEMGRSRGFWWSPSGDRIAACRVDDSSVPRWHISDPAHPDRAPRVHPYPAAGSVNANVSLHVLPVEGADRIDVAWDRAAFPYLVAVAWADDERLLVTVQSRDQRTVRVLQADPGTGVTTTRFDDVDAQWVELVPGVPGELGDGRLVTCADRGGARRLLVDAVPVTPDDLQVRAVSHIAHDVVFTANPLADPTVLHVFRWSPDRGVEPLETAPGVHAAAVGGETVVVRSTDLSSTRPRTRVLGGPSVRGHGEVALVQPEPIMLRVGPSAIATAVFLPSGVGPDDRLPVLLDPYGGPHAQRVVSSLAAHATSQWFADQGFAVVVADGRGTPGRGSAWERAVHLDLAGPVLDDQVEALLGAAEAVPQIDLGRVAMRGWSFGGYLAALAVLRRPDVVHAAIAGAPVTEWRLYDTHYTERYLGDPGTDAAPYDRCSLLGDAGLLRRPLLLVHGLADDNVAAAHTLQLSSALLAAGRPHQVLPLSGVTHMTPHEVVAENLLLLQLEFLRAALPTG